MLDERIAHLIRQGRMAVEQGNLAMAREYFQAAVDLDPENGNAWFALYEVLEDPASARKALARVLELDPGNVRAQQEMMQFEEGSGGGARVVDADAPSGESAPPPRGTGPLTIEQELRAALRIDAQGAASGPAGSGAVTVDSGGSRLRALFPAGSDDMPYRVAVAVLVLFLLIGMLCIVLLLGGVIPPRI